ncbi:MULTISPECIES: Hpt domain-containing protein [unclassified Lentimicrobium]|uniref:Hpt domain-containing protein n=1 Tax=unclassified Lentimicrobium TaxID=2677434 RepID=UPI001557B3A3|nr:MULTISPECIES: Hpt domain-containing protein [unclassified Lentimicrobium]NPD47696.1 Hpt domain-containing protein [Lentimicrobium sp. S6]NPD83880.1 Hpt domain-containing protein [Lentimicrobium sp. L6]
MINKATFNSNYEIFDREIVKEIIDIYIAEYPERMVNLEKNIKENDLESLYKNAHSMKGVTANFFDKETEEFARQLESKGREGDSTGLEEIFEELKKASESLIDELEALGREYS